jgi:hypothetical protein
MFSTWQFFSILPSFASYTALSNLKNCHELNIAVGSLGFYIQSFVQICTVFKKKCHAHCKFRHVSSYNSRIKVKFQKCSRAKHHRKVLMNTCTKFYRATFITLGDIPCSLNLDTGRKSGRKFVRDVSMARSRKTEQTTQISRHRVDALKIATSSFRLETAQTNRCVKLSVWTGLKRSFKNGTSASQSPRAIAWTQVSHKDEKRVQQVVF